MNDNTAMDSQWIPLGTLLLRLSLGVMFLVHSVYLKGVVYTLPGTAQFFASIGLPAFLAYVAFTAEAIGGTLLILGVRTRLVAVALIPVLIGATWARSANGWLFTNANGGWEYPLFLTAATGVQVLLGNGALALSGATKTAAGKPIIDGVSRPLTQ